jgi:hypothetical protein
MRRIAASASGTATTIAPICSSSPSKVNTLAEPALHSPHCGRGNSVELRVNVGQRLRNHAQDLAGRGLLFERLGQLAIARLQLVEQPGVLDRDHRLFGEGLQQGDLRGRPGPRIAPRDSDGTPIGLS